jgi:hypothetical protein
MPILYTDTNGIGFDGDRNSRQISISTEAALNLFRAYVTRRPVVSENVLGLYSFVTPNPGDPKKVRFASLSTPRHLLQPANGCGWNPKGKVSMNVDEYDLGSVDYDGQQCPDEWGKCLNGIFGDGNNVKDVLSTPEGRALFDELVNRIYTGLGNSFWDLLHFANHPVIELANSGAWWNGVETSEGWADYYNQQIHPKVGGIITILDNLKDVEGLDQLQVSIQSSDISTDGKTYQGDVIALFEKLKEAAKSEFAFMIDEERGDMVPVMVVSASIYKAYKTYLTNTYSNIPEGFQIFYTGEDGMRRSLRNVLMYDGIPVVRNSSWSAFDRINGVVTHRAVLTAKGNFGVGYDTEAVRGGQFNGMGMTVDQWLRAPYKGQVYMTTRFAVTGAIVDPNFLTMACYVHKPA